MYEELSNKFKDILNRIILCINDYIEKNIHNPSLVESKLLLINNYTIDILYNPEITRNSFTNATNQNNSQQYIFQDKKSLNQLISSRDYEEKKNSLNKFKQKYFKMIKENSENNEFVIHSYIDAKKDSKHKNESSIDKFKIIKLKRKLKDEQEKNKIKELSYLKRLLDVQKDLFLIENKKIKSKENNNRNSFDFTTINNSYKNRNINNYNSLTYLNNTKNIKHSISQCEMKERLNNNNNEKYNFNDMKLKYELLRKKTILKKNNFIKFDFGEIKKSIVKKMDKIKGIRLSSPSTLRKAKINKF